MGRSLAFLCHSTRPVSQVIQAANNTAVMASVGADQRGVVSGLLSLSRNLGLITGASVMGAVFAVAVGADDVSHAGPAAVAGGMRVTFGVAVGLVGVALLVALSSQARAAVRRSSWGLALLSTCLINHFELFGLQQVFARLTGRALPTAQFSKPLLYRWV